MTDARKAIPEDIDHDPEYKRQRRVAGYLLGIAVNALQGRRPIWADEPDKSKLGAQLREIALANGIVVFDEWHHAPMCKANNWSRMALPEGPCTCGAEMRKIR